MLKRSVRYWTILSLAISSTIVHAGIITWSGNIYKHIHEYKELHSKFSKKICTPGADSKYYSLYKDYRGSGFYLPEFKGDVDRQAIIKNLFHFTKKIAHIDALKKELVKNESLASFESMSDPILKTLNELLELKKNYNVEVSAEKRDEVRNKSRKGLKELLEHFDAFMTEYSFLKSYNYPNDHLKNRFEYDTYKDSEKDSEKHKANQIFFYRRLVEDGAMNPDNSRPDVFVRTALDTIYLNLKKLT